MKKLCLFLALVLLINILPVNLAMAETLAITQQPKNVVVASGETAKVSVTATGDGLSYRWYYAEKGAATFSASSITTASYSLTMNSTRSGRRVYCVVSDSSGNKVTSNTVTLTMGTALKITKQPANVTVASGSTAKVSVTATGDGLSYRWYYADKGVSTFSASSVTTASYSLTMTEARDGRRVYCVVTDQYGRKVTSSTVTLSMAPSLTITKQPANVTVASGKTATVSVTASGDGLSYRWYYADKGVTTFSASSVTTASYSLTMTAARDGRRVYCVVTDKYGNKATSNTVTLSMSSSLTITKQPASVTAASGATAKVSVTASGDGLSYRWYYADKGVSTFSASSVTTASYALTMTAARDGRRVYCVVSDSAGNKVTSNTVTLSMAPSLTITKQPANVTVASGKTATVSVTASGDGLSYRWYYAEKGSSTFSASSVTTASYSLTMSSARSGRRVYCVITDKYGNKATSNTVTLSLRVPAELKITQQPTDVTVLSGKQATVSVTATGDGLTYCWYYKDLTAAGFAKTSVTTSTYSIWMNDARDGRQVYCVVTDEYGNQVTSNTATLSIPWPIRITLQPVDVAVYEGEVLEVNIAATGEGITYRWYYADQDVDTFTASSNTTSTYTLTMDSARNGRRVYCLVSDQYGQSLQSDVVTLTMLGENDVPEGLKYYKGNDYVSINHYHGSASTLRIPSEIEGYPVTTINDRAFEDCTSLTTVVIPNSVTSTGYGIFMNCTNLSSIVIPDSMTKISYYTFWGCTSLTSITLPSSITVIGDYAFNKCTSLTNITIPSSVTTIHYAAFQNCSSLTSITIPNGVTAIYSEAFARCSALKSITIPSSVTSIGNTVFRGCSSLTTINIPSSVTSIGDNVFYACSSLTTVYIPSSVTSIGDDVFYGCSSLAAIYVKNKSYAHQWCIDNGYEDKVQFY